MWVGMATAAGLLTPWSAAGPLDVAHLPTDARLVAHADLDGLRNTEAGKLLLGTSGAGVVPLLERFRHDVGIDAARDVHDVTLYSRSACMAHTVAVLTCTSRGALGFLDTMRQGTLPEFEQGGEPKMEYWSWRRREDRTFAAVCVGETDDERRIVFADSLAGLREAVERLASPPDVAGGTAEPAERGMPEPDAGSFLFVWVQDVGDCDLWRPQAQALRHASSLLVQAGWSASSSSEMPPRLYARASVSADTPENAGRIRRVVDGTLAMYELSVEDEPGAAAALEVLREVRSTTDGLQVRVGCEAASEALEPALRAMLSPASGQNARATQDRDALNGGTP